MKKIIYVLLSFVFFFSCNKEENIKNEIHEVKSEAQDLQKAIKLVNEFSEKIHNENSTRAYTPISLSLSAQKKIAVQKAQTRNGSNLSDSINLYYFKIENKGRIGFAIASGEKSGGQVYAYVENGELADTINCPSAAYIISQIPIVIAENLKDTTTKSSIASTTVTLPLMRTQWNQNNPYNKNMPTNGKCNRPYYYAGCATIAAAQAIVYYRKYPIDQPWDTYNSLREMYSSHPLAGVCASFVSSVANEIGVKFSCDETSVNSLSSTANAFTKWGYNIERHATNDVDKNKLLDCFLNNNLIIMAGMTKHTGHVWVADGMFYDLVNMKLISIHCNFGNYTSLNGWYSVPNTAYNKPTFGASQDGANPTDGSNAEANYYRNNDYIYFHEKATSSPVQ